MSDGIVVCAFYNRTAWEEATTQEEIAAQLNATLKGDYNPEHEYVNVWGSWIDPREDAAEWVWEQLNHPDEKPVNLPLDRSMCVGDIVLICGDDPEKVRIIAAYICQPSDWKYCPEFIDHLMKKERS